MNKTNERGPHEDRRIEDVGPPDGWRERRRHVERRIPTAQEVEVSAEDWEALIEWLETLEDIQIARAAFADLKAAGGDRKRAGWVEWEEAEMELA